MPWKQAESAYAPSEGPDGARAARPVSDALRASACHAVINSTQDNRIRGAGGAVLGMITGLEQHWLEGCWTRDHRGLCKDEVASSSLPFRAPRPADYRRGTQARIRQL